MGRERPIEGQCHQVAGAVAQAQGMACLGIHRQFHRRANGKVMGTGEGMHHHESPPISPPA